MHLFIYFIYLYGLFCICLFDFAFLVWQPNGKICNDETTDKLVDPPAVRTEDGPVFFRYWLYVQQIRPVVCWANVKFARQPSRLGLGFNTGGFHFCLACQAIIFSRFFSWPIPILARPIVHCQIFRTHPAWFRPIARTSCLIYRPTSVASRVVSTTELWQFHQI